MKLNDHLDFHKLPFDREKIREQVQNIERGYETLVEKFVALGADMYRSEIPDSTENSNRA